MGPTSICTQGPGSLRYFLIRCRQGSTFQTTSSDHFQSLLQGFTGVSAVHKVAPGYHWLLESRGIRPTPIFTSSETSPRLRQSMTGSRFFLLPTRNHNGHPFLSRQLANDFRHTAVTHKSSTGSELEPNDKHPDDHTFRDVDHRSFGSEWKGGGVGLVPLVIDSTPSVPVDADSRPLDKLHPKEDFMLASRSERRNSQGFEHPMSPNETHPSRHDFRETIAIPKEFDFVRGGDGIEFRNVAGDSPNLVHPENHTFRSLDEMPVSEFDCPRGSPPADRLPPRSLVFLECS